MRESTAWFVHLGRRLLKWDWKNVFLSSSLNGLYFKVIYLLGLNAKWTKRRIAEFMLSGIKSTCERTIRTNWISGNWRFNDVRRFLNLDPSWLSLEHLRFENGLNCFQPTKNRAQEFCVPSPQLFMIKLPAFSKIIRENICNNKKQTPPDNGRQSEGENVEHNGEAV